MLVSPTINELFAPARVQWMTVTACLEHQTAAVMKLLPSRVGALFMEMGTGKTRTAIEFARIRQSKISRVIWFCPVTLKATIYREIRKHTTLTDDEIYIFDDKTQEQTVPLDCWFYIVGIESMGSSDRSLYSVMQLLDDSSFVIVDESTYIKGHSAKRTKRITRIAEPARYRMILTGTPITQGVVDLWAQMRFLSEKILGYKSFYTFAHNHLIYSQRHAGQIVGSRDVQWLTERMAPYVYQVTKDQCLTLPEKLYEDYTCALTDEQQDAYFHAKVDFADDLLKYDDRDDGLQSGIAIFRLFSRLQGIACGIADDLPIPHRRLDLLETVLKDMTDTHVVVFCKRTHNIDEIAARLKQIDKACYVIDGRVPEEKRDGIQQEWTQSGGFLVIARGVGGHGLDLTAAATVIFYSASFKYSEQVQAEDRCHRIGQTRPVTYISLWTNCGIEQLIADALTAKSNALAHLRREIDKVKGSGKEKLKKFIMSL